MVRRGGGGVIYSIFFKYRRLIPALKPENLGAFIDNNI